MNRAQRRRAQRSEPSRRRELGRVQGMFIGTPEELDAMTFDCPDCLSTAERWFDVGAGIPRVSIRHDASCPTWLRLMPADRRRPHRG